MRKDFERAHESCDRACSLSRDASGGRWTGEILKHYGAIYQSTGRLELALDSLAQARRVAESERDTLLAAETARELAEVYRKQGRNQDTLKALNESLRLFSDFNAKRNLADVRERVTRLEHRFLDVVRTWGESIESKDHYTRGHCERVATYACALASASGMDSERLRWFRMGRATPRRGQNRRAFVHPQQTRPTHRQRMGHHEAASPSRGAPAPGDRVPLGHPTDGAPSSRALGRRRVPGWLGGGRYSSFGPDPLPCRRIRRAHLQPDLPRRIDARSRALGHA